MCTINQMKQNVQTAQKDMDEKSEEIQFLKNEIESLKNVNKDVLNTEQAKG